MVFSVCLAPVLGRSRWRGRPDARQYRLYAREFDMTSGLAWNYYGPLELRAVGYDRENFNRGVSLVSPGGTTNDGDGIEQRLYLNDEYAKLGQEKFRRFQSRFCEPRILSDQIHDRRGWHSIQAGPLCPSISDL